MTQCPIHPEEQLDADGDCLACFIAKHAQPVQSVKCQRCNAPVLRLSVGASDSPYMHRWDLYCQKKCKRIGWVEFDDSEPAYEHVQQVLDGFTINMRGGRPEGLVYPRVGEFANWKAILKERLDAAKKDYDETPDDMMSSVHRIVAARYHEAKACFEALFGSEGKGEIP